MKISCISINIQTQVILFTDEEKEGNYDFFSFLSMNVKRYIIFVEFCPIFQNGPRWKNYATEYRKKSTFKGLESINLNNFAIRWSRHLHNLFSSWCKRFLD